MSLDPISDHPDLNDPKWLAEANKRAKKDIRKMRNKARRGKRRRWAVNLVLLTAIATVGVLIYRGNFGKGSTSTNAAAESSPPSTTATAMIPDVVVDLNQPYTGTPAAGWSDGEAGFAPPAAAPVGAYQAEQVADAYAKVRQVLIEARLDRKVIETHDPEPYLTLLAPDSAANLRSDFLGEQLFTTKIAKEVRLLPVPPKVNGKMSASVDGDGSLVVHTDYVVAYAFHTDKPEQLRQALEVVAIVRAQADYTLYDKRWAKTSQGLFLTNIHGYTYSMACGPAKKGFLAPLYSERAPDGPTASREPKDYFDPNQTLSVENGCPE
jgi:hypothetical protein